MTRLVCGICGESTSSFFLTIGEAMICTDCGKKHKGKVPQYQKPRTFVRYICKTHDCGTYNVNMMFNRHAMKDCVIISQTTLGVIRPATFGGVNGDISRTHYLGVNQLQRLLTNMENYKKFASIKIKVENMWRNKKLSYHDKKYYNKHVKFLKIVEDVDYHKNDEILKKLKFNLNVFIQGMPKKYRPTPVMSQGERNKLYYKDLMANFKKQVVVKK